MGGGGSFLSFAGGQRLFYAVAEVDHFHDRFVIAGQIEQIVVFVYAVQSVRLFVHDRFEFSERHDATSVHNALDVVDVVVRRFEQRALYANDTRKAKRYSDVCRTDALGTEAVAQSTDKRMGREGKAKIVLHIITCETGVGLGPKFSFCPSHATSYDSKTCVVSYPKEKRRAKTRCRQKKWFITPMGRVHGRI